MHHSGNNQEVGAFFYFSFFSDLVGGVRGDRGYQMGGRGRGGGGGGGKKRSDLKSHSALPRVVFSSDFLRGAK